MATVGSRGQTVQFGIASVDTLTAKLLTTAFRPRRCHRTHRLTGATRAVGERSGVGPTSYDPASVEGPRIRRMPRETGRKGKERMKAMEPVYIVSKVVAPLSRYIETRIEQ